MLDLATLDKKTLTSYEKIIASFHVSIDGYYHFLVNFKNRKEQEEWVKKYFVVQSVGLQFLDIGMKAIDEWSKKVTISEIEKTILEMEKDNEET